MAALARYVPLDDETERAVHTLLVDQRSLAAGHYIVREGQRPKRCGLLIDGYTYRQKLSIDGQRAIVALQAPGDFIDIQNLFLPESDHDLQTLTHCTVVEFALGDMRALAAVHPTINAALWTCGLVEASIAREWLLNVGRRDAHARMAHLLCEMAVRREAAGIGRDEAYVLPMTQEQVGDALGLTAVHVNRVLRALEKNALIGRRKREVRIADWDGLRRAADFNDRYLHLDIARQQ